MAAIWIVFVTAVLCETTLATALVCEVFYDGFCIDMTHQRFLGHNAQTACSEMEGTLVNVINEEVEELIKDLLKTHHVNKAWIGNTFESIQTETTQRANQNASDVNTVCGISINKYGQYHKYKGQCPYTEKLYAICEHEGRNCLLEEALITHSKLKNCLKKKTLVPGFQLELECTSGYHIEGPSIIECLLNGSWSDLPKCRPICEKPVFTSPDIGIVNRKPLYYVGESAYLLCNDGFFGDGRYPKTHKSITCLRSQMWSHNTVDLECIPIDNIRYTYPMESLRQVEAEQGEEIILYCSDNPTSVPVGDIQWLKNQNLINEVENKSNDYIIGEDKSLKIVNFSLSLEGRYTCENVHLSNGYITYNVKEKSQCGAVSSSRERDRIEQGDSIILRCRNNKYYSRPEWYKDGIRIWGDVRKDILQDGALKLSRATFHDSGTYTCITEYSKDECRDGIHVHIIQLTVVPHATTLCGLIPGEKLREVHTFPKMTTYHKPWLASLVRMGESHSYCYGALISDRWVLTLARCLESMNRFRPALEIRLGLERQADTSETHPEQNKIIVWMVSEGSYEEILKKHKNNDSVIVLPLKKRGVETLKWVPREMHMQRGVPITVRAKEIFMHPDYFHRGNDVGLIRLLERITVAETVRPICLPTASLIAENHECEGSRSNKGYVVVERPSYSGLRGSQSKLMQVLRHKRCENLIDQPLSEDTFCAVQDHEVGRFLLGRKELAAPFEIPFEDTWVLWGLFVEEEEKTNILLFSDISFHIEWIQTQIKENNR